MTESNQKKQGRAVPESTQRELLEIERTSDFEWSLYRAILASSTEYGLIVSNRDAVIIEWNEGARVITGWSREEVLGRPTSLLFIEEDIENGAQHAEMRAALENGAAADVRWHLRKDGSLFWASGYMTPLRSVETSDHLGFLKILSDRTAEKKAEERQAALQGELHHRTANLLAVVQAIARQTFAGVDTALLETFEGRIRALSNAQQSLRQGNWESASLQETVATALKPHGVDENRFSVEGPDLILSPRRAIALTLALHELATNAAKYGALSAHDGHIHIDWQFSGDTLTFHWRERNGPPIEPSSRSSGFGSLLIKDYLAREFDGTVHLDYASGGLEFELQAPLVETE